MGSSLCSFCQVVHPFESLFSKRVFRHATLLLTGAILAPGRRTVTAALRVMGLAEDAGFQNYHRVLNRAVWCARGAAGILLRQLVDAFAPEGPLVFGLDDTIERRWGAKIQARGIYRDPVRSSHGHFVKASGLRWLCLALLAAVPWAGRIWALPFLTTLCPSERYAFQRGRRHKTFARVLPRLPGLGIDPNRGHKLLGCIPALELLDRQRLGEPDPCGLGADPRDAAQQGCERGVWLQERVETLAQGRYGHRPFTVCPV